MQIPCLQTPDLILRPWDPGDADRLFEILQEQGIFEYIPGKASPPRAWVDRYIARHLKHWQARGCGHWAVVARSSGQLIGWNGLEYLPELDETEVAYLLSRAVWGQGFATEAAWAAVGFGFEQCGLEQITGLVHPENRASIRVLEKCGLTFSDPLHLWDTDLLRYRISRAVYRARLGGKPD
jgi:RimJ/RimL family protein N-acetyltransferase